MQFKIGERVRYKHCVYERAGCMTTGSCNYWWVRKAGGVVLEPYSAPWAAVRVKWRWDPNSYDGFTLEQAEECLEVVVQKMSRKDKKSRKKEAMRAIC